MFILKYVVLPEYVTIFCKTKEIFKNFNSNAFMKAGGMCQTLFLIVAGMLGS
jgi:NAD(P)H-hydrate repair Nnr-like enzyme with NAD(P)H-hydrate dehydratase domain